MALSDAKVKGIIAMRILGKRFFIVFLMLVFCAPIYVKAQEWPEMQGPPVVERKEEPTEVSQEEKAADEFFALPGPVRAMRLYEKILSDGNAESHNKLLTPKSMGLLAKKKYPADKMKKEAARIKNCRRQNLLQEGDRAVIIFPDNPNVCFPYLLQSVIDGWRIDLYTMKSIFLIKSGERWTIKSNIQSHPYEFGIKVVRMGVEDDEIKYK